MARKPQQTENTAVVVTDADTPALPAMREAANQLAVMPEERQATVRAVAAQLGYQLPADCTDPDLIQRDIAANMRRSVEACLEVGRGLRVLKEACEHGQFISRIDALGIEVRVAQKFMASAAKFSNAASTPLLKAARNQTKLFEMLVLDDEQIEELELTGQTGELKLDDVATMSVKELRKKLRELKAEVEAAEERIAVRGQQRDEAEEQARGFKKLLPDGKVDALMAEATKQMNDALAAINGKFRQALLALEALDQGEAGIKDYRPMAAGLVGQLQQSITTIRDEFLLVDIIGDGTPEWMRATADLGDEA